MDRIENAQMNSQGTRKLYYENVHQTDFTAVVMECVPDKEEGYYRIVLDASAFFPEEGGQSADKGTLNGQEVLDVMIKLAKENITMVVVTHEMGFARQVADRIVFMADGQIIEEGTPDHFFDNPSNERVKQFLGKIIR